MMVDHVTQATLLNVPRELVPANIDVVGAPANSNIVTLKELSGETPGDAVSSWSYQGGSESDELSLLGSADVCSYFFCGDWASVEVEFFFYNPRLVSVVLLMVHSILIFQHILFYTKQPS